MQQQDTYRILKKLDAETRWFGLTIDEAVPVGIILLIAFVSGHWIVGFVLGGLTLMGIRRFKKGKGMGWLLGMILWQLPDRLFRGLLVKKAPDSCVRCWMK